MFNNSIAFLYHKTYSSIFEIVVSDDRFIDYN